MNGAQSERVSYTFSIPAGQNDYSLIYNYAVVFQNPNHSDFQQPRFTSRVFDVTSNQYVNCGSFEFVASSGLLGFQQSPMGQNVFYKPWSPITINLNGYAGKTMRIEFTNNDCTLGGHFGYAYLDVNENCSTPITGNVYCNGADSIRLKAPFGFQEYRWYNADFSQLLGTTNTLLISPPPPPNTTFALEIIPYPNLGCQDTLYSNVVLSADAFKFSVTDTIKSCAFTTVDLTAPTITTGSTAGLRYSYFKDVFENEYLPNPNMVGTTGRYYIKAVNASGCNDIKPVTVAILDPPQVTVSSPLVGCFPSSVNLTAPAVTSGSEPGLTYSYWKDSTQLVPVRNPGAIDTSGTYYVKGANSIGCFNIKPVTIDIANISLQNRASCGEVDITGAGVTFGSSSGLVYSYFTDSAASIPLSNAKNITTSGRYFVKGTTASGCSIIKSIQVTVNPIPNLVVTKPPVVVFPATVNLNQAFTRLSNVNYSYWLNAAATTPLAQPSTVSTSGTYYIKATTISGCEITKPIVVVIDPPPLPKLVAPNAFSPNNDGINDLFRPTIDGQVTQYYLRVMNRHGQEVFSTANLSSYWDGTFNKKPLPVGTYYWIFEGTDLYRSSKVTQSGSITLLR